MLIIERLDLIAFGRFAGESIDFSAGPARFHLVYGPNESGKSTSLRAIHSLLFGMPQRSDDNFLHDYKQMRVGGRLRDEHSGQVIDCVRRRGQRRTLLSPDEKSEIDPALVAAMLHGVDGSTFSRQFGMTHGELVAGGRAIIDGGGDLGEVLFAAGAGAAALRNVKQQLEKDRGELFVSRGSSRSLNKLIAKYQELAKDLRELRLLPSAYEAKYKELQRAAAEADASAQRLRERTAAVQRMKAYAKALPLVHKRDALVTQLATIPSNTPLLDDAFTERRRELEAERLVAQQQLRTQGEQLDNLRRRHDEIAIDDRWLRAATDIKSLMNELGQIESDEKQLDECMRTVEDANRRIREAIDQLSQKKPAAPLTEDDADAMPLFADPPGPSVAGSVDQRLDRLILSTSVRAEIEQLAAQSGGLMERLETATASVASLQRALASTTEQLDQLPRIADPAPLADTLAAVGGNPQRLLEAAAKAADEVKKSQRRALVAMRKLRGFQGTVDQAKSLVLPAAGQVAQTAHDLHQAKIRLQQASAALEAEAKRFEEAQALLLGESNAAEVPTADDLERLRCQRDRQIDVLRQRAVAGQPAVPDQVDALALAVRQVDRATDQMHVAHDQVVRHQRLAEEVAVAKRRLDDAHVKQAAARQSHDDIAGRWQSLWSAIGVAASDPQAMQQWCEDHASLLELVDQCEEKREVLCAINDEIRRHCEHLRAALRANGQTESCGALPADGNDLLSLHLLAKCRHDELTAIRGQHVELEKNRKRLLAELETAKDSQSQCEARLQRWQDRWTELTAPLADDQGLRPEAIYEFIRHIDRCHQLRRERDAASERIAHCRHRRSDYLARAADIAAPLLVTISDRQYGPAIRDLARRSEEQQKRAAERRLLCDQIKALEGDIQSAARSKEAAETKLQQLCSEARCDRIDQLPALEQASAQRRHGEQELNSVQCQLRELAESQPLEEFTLQTREHSSDTLRIDIQMAQTELEKLEHQWGEQQRRVGQLEQEVAAMDGSDRAARVQQEQQNLLAAIRRGANDYARLTIAEDALRRAIDHYRQHNEGPILSLASGFFSRLTAGEYASLQVDFDDSEQPRLYGVRPDRTGQSAAVAETHAIGESNGTGRSAAGRGPSSGPSAAFPKVPAGSMSDGTADALYLSLRLASLEVHLDRHQPIPLIFDDCLIQFDDQRTVAALQILSELAMRTQVILFTHHQHLVDLANEHLQPGGFHLHQLTKDV